MAILMNGEFKSWLYMQLMKLNLFYHNADFKKLQTI
jgi:hypothetical protein